MKFGYLILFASVEVFITIKAFINKENKIYSLMWLLYSTSAVFCIIGEIYIGMSSSKGYMQAIWYDLSDTTLFGYLLIILCCYIAFVPFKEYDSNNSLQYFGHGNNSRKILYLFTYIYLFCAILFLALSINEVIRILNISDFGTLRTSLYDNSENESALIITNNVLANVCLKICLEFKFISAFISLTMIKERKKKKLAITLLIVTIFVFFIESSANAARGGIAIFFYCTFLIYTLFQKYLTKKAKRRVRLLAVIFLGVAVSFFMAVTVSRFVNNSKGNNLILTNLVFYLGHGPIEFSKITGTLERFAYGGTILGRLSNHYFGTPYSWASVQSKIGYPNIGPVFTTYLGYLYTDFGAIGCLLFVSIWSFFMTNALKKRPNNLSTIYVFLYYISYYVSGAFAVGRLEYAAMITTFIGYAVLRIFEIQSKKKISFSSNSNTIPIETKIHQSGFRKKKRFRLVLRKRIKHNY